MAVYDQAIYDWAKTTCAEQGVPMENFASSFSDGRAFVALVHATWPDQLEPANASTILAEPPTERASQAFSLAKKNSGVTAPGPDAKLILETQDSRANYKFASDVYLKWKIEDHKRRRSGSPMPSPALPTGKAEVQQPQPTGMQPQMVGLQSMGTAQMGTPMPAAGAEVRPKHASHILARPGARTISFRVRCPTSYGENMFVVGSDPALGHWSPLQGFGLQYTPSSEFNWRGAVYAALGWENPMEFKFVKRRGDTIMWEDGPNRSFSWPKHATTDIDPNHAFLVIECSFGNTSEMKIFSSSVDPEAITR